MLHRLLALLATFLFCAPAFAGYGFQGSANATDDDGRDFSGSLQVTQWKLSAIRRGDTSVGNCRVMCGPGDSITEGLAATSTLKSYPGWMVKRLNAAGIPAVLSPIIYTGNAIPIYEPRLGAIPPGWHIGAFDPILNGYQTNGDGVANGSPMTCTPDYPFNKFKIFWTKLGPDITANVAIDGVNVGTIGAGGSTVGHGQVTEFTCTLGTHTISVTPIDTDATKYLSLTAFDAWDSTTPCIQVLNAGLSGTKVSHWLNYATTYNAEIISPTRMIPGQWTPDLHIEMLGANDIGADDASATPISTFKSQYMALTKGLLSATPQTDVFMMTSNTAFGRAAAAIPYNNAQRDIAKACGIGYLSMPKREGPFEQAAARGWSNTSSHPNDKGYEDIEDAAFNAIFLGTGGKL